MECTHGFDSGVRQTCDVATFCILITFFTIPHFFIILLFQLQFLVYRQALVMVCAQSHSFRRTIIGQLQWSLRWWPPRHCSVLPLPLANLVGLILDLCRNSYLLGDAPHRSTSPPIFLRHLCIFLLIVASPRRSALAAPIPESNDHVT